jgi:carbonic anhydrase
MFHLARKLIFQSEGSGKMLGNHVKPMSLTDSPIQVRDRRRFLAGAIGACAIAPVTFGLTQTQTRTGGALTKEQRDRMTPGQVLEELKKGNERFQSGKMITWDYRDQQRTSAAGQYPAAVILGCVDSRAPAEIIFNVGIGDTFNARIAGNVINDDLLGSLEFSCAVAGAKVILLLGHTACGAIKGAIDDVEMGNLTGLLARVKPAITATSLDGPKSSKNAAYVDRVGLANVRLGLDQIRRRSPLLADLENKQTILIIGGMYDVSTGIVEFLAKG